MKKTLVIIVVIVAAVLFVRYLMSSNPELSTPYSPTYQAPVPTTAKPKTTTKTYTPPADTTVVNTVSSNTTTGTVQSFPTDRSFTVNASDRGADLTTINIPKGTRVTLTFNVSALGTNYGGIDFRSSILNTGAISGGESKTVTFLANSSFVFLPYGATTGTIRPYKIVVNAQ